MITHNSTNFSDKIFDFVIVGGGTTGLALAARLSEDPSISVAVLEAGDNAIGDPKITVPAQFASPLGNPKYDWSFLTAKQHHSNDRQLMWSRGKVLGGTSAINFYAWVKPPATEVNAFEKLGNPGWNWADYVKYSKKSETFHPPTKEQTDLYPHTYDLNLRGTSGPVQVTIPPHVHTVDTLFQAALVKTGLKPIRDPYGGDITGAWIASSNLDPKTWTRSYSTTAYLVPCQDRPNLTVLTQALVSRVIFADKSDNQGLVATGAEFIHDGGTYTIYAKKEVVLSAGTIKTPHILELSGIGRPEVLSKINVEAKIQLPGVGENLQDHAYIGVSYELNPIIKHETFDLLRNPEYAKGAMRSHAEGKGILRAGITSYAYLPLSIANPTEASKLIKSMEKEIEQYKQSPELPAGLREQLDIQLTTLHNDALPDMEVIAFPGLFSGTIRTAEPGKSYLSVMGVLNHPVSRGTIHAKSSNPREAPEIDPRYFEKDSDIEILVQHIKYIRRLAETEPLMSGIIGSDIEPGVECTTDEQIREFIKRTFRSAWHGIGTCSMLPRDKNGVVDPQLKVYGTKNLRVVDISIIPLHIAAHTQATAYVIAEKAADIIRSAYSRG